MTEVDKSVSEIEILISWFSDNAKSSNLVAISMTLGKMSTQCYYFSKLVSEAYELQANCEDVFKEQKALFIKNSSESATKAGMVVEADPYVRQAKRNFTDASNVYFKLKNHSHQFEHIMDCVRQRISVEKSLNVKGI